MRRKCQGVNFYDEIKSDLEADDFAEVMTVDDGGETVRMWMKADKAVVSEFLLIVGGDDNVLIYITGNFNMKDLEELGRIHLITILILIWIYRFPYL